MSELILDICRKYFDEISHVDLIRNIPPKEIGCAEFWQKMGPVLTCYAYTPENTSWNEGLENGFEFGFAAGVYLSKSIQRSQVMTSKSDELKPCPFCGEQERLTLTRFLMFCQVCGAEGPHAHKQGCHIEQKLEAHRLWNTRTLSTNGESE